MIGLSFGNRVQKMEQSPLRLEWLVYPSAAFKFMSQGADVGVVDSVVPADLDASVVYSIDGKHTAELKLSSGEGSSSCGAYKFSVDAVALFSVDIDRAKELYLKDGKDPESLPVTVAVNIARILYSSARELLASFSARGPYGSVMVDSVLIGPKDVRIASSVPRDEILRKVFILSDVDGEPWGEEKK